MIEQISQVSDDERRAVLEQCLSSGTTIHTDHDGKASCGTSGHSRGGVFDDNGLPRVDAKTGCAEQVTVGSRLSGDPGVGGDNTVDDHVETLGETGRSENGDGVAGGRDDRRRHIAGCQQLECGG